MSWRALLLIAAFAVLGAVGGLMLGRQLSLPPERPTPAGVAVAAIGDPLPAATLSGLDDQPQSLAQWQGRPLLINFWATWCAPCIAEMPLLDAFRDAQPAGGLEVIGVALDDPAEVRAFLEGTVQVGYPILLGGHPNPRDLSVQLGNSRSVLPFSVLVDAEHRILATKFGDFDADELADWVADHL